MPTIEHTISIRAAPEAVFDLISHVEDFPRYSRIIHAVRSLGHDTWRWTIRVAGFELEWDAVVTGATQRPRHFAWHSIRGVENSGSFDLQPATGGTEVRLAMSYRLANPLLERLVDTVAAPLMQRVAAELLEQVRRRLEPSHAN